MAESISPEQMAVYQRTALMREQARRLANAERRACAVEAAHRAAVLLRRQFSAIRVLLFGSTVHGYWFTSESDIDLVAQGIAADQFWRAWNTVDAAEPDFEINLVAWEEASPALRAAIEREGIVL